MKTNRNFDFRLYEVEENTEIIANELPTNAKMLYKSQCHYYVEKELTSAAKAGDDLAGKKFAIYKVHIKDDLTPEVLLIQTMYVKDGELYIE